MKISAAQAAWLAAGIAQESSSHAFPGRCPWLETSIRTILADIDTPSLADLARAGLRAAASSEHRTPAGIRHELERALHAVTNGPPSNRVPTWRPDPKPDACPPPAHLLTRVRNLQAHITETPAPAEPCQRPAATR